MPGIIEGARNGRGLTCRVFRMLSCAALLPAVLSIAQSAGAAILEVYQRNDHGLTHKPDASPLTAADLAAHALIDAGLRALRPTLPVLSEEAAAIAWEERRCWTHYWLVDPLDGTKEFLRRNGEFTVNIALIAHGVPVLGVVHVPLLGTSYVGVQGLGAWKLGKGQCSSVKVRPLPGPEAALRVVASRTHRGEQLDAWLDRVRQRFAAVELVSMGSSLKICLVAEGQADLYPRLAPTAAWDTAAAQAVLEAAGGSLLDDTGKILRYNARAELLNPLFFAIADAARGSDLCRLN